MHHAFHSIVYGSLYISGDAAKLSTLRIFILQAFSARGFQVGYPRPLGRCLWTASDIGLLVGPMPTLVSHCTRLGMTSTAPGATTSARLMECRLAVDAW